MKKYEIINKNVDFNDIIKTGVCLRNRDYSIYYKNNTFDYPKFGLAVSKKCGNAVQRNKIKRQLRSIVSTHKNFFSDGMNYIIMVRKGIVCLTYQEMEQSLIRLIRKEEK